MFLTFTKVNWTRRCLDGAEVHFGHLTKESDLCKINSKLLRYKGRKIERARSQESEHTVLTNLPKPRPSEIEY